MDAVDVKVKDVTERYNKHREFDRDLFVQQALNPLQASMNTNEEQKMYASVKNEMREERRRNMKVKAKETIAELIAVVL
jgi:hypothetical protein